MKSLLVPRVGGALLAILGFLVLAADAGAGDRSDVLRLRAENLAAAGRCDEALSVLERASAEAPQDARIRALTGRCDLELRRYDAAAASLERARAIDPSLPSIDLLLGVVRYHLEDYKGARSAFDEARKQDEISKSDAALIDLYGGLLLLRDKDTREAALAFERARARNAQAVEPVASYYAALSWQSLDETEQVEEALDRVLEEQQTGPWADEARKVLAVEKKRREARNPKPRRWAGVRAGAEYDSNVVLLGAGVPLPPTISDESDTRVVWNANLGTELMRKERDGAGVMLNYTGFHYLELDQYDQHYPSISGWYDHAFDRETQIRVRGDFGYGWIGGDPFVLGGDLVFDVDHEWSRYGSTRFYLEGYYNDFRYKIDVQWPEVREGLNQDGGGPRAGAIHTLPVRGDDTELYGGLEYTYNITKGTEFDFMALDVRLGVRARLPWELDLDVMGGFIYRPFDNPSWYYPGATVDGPAGPDRQDDVWRATAVLSKEIIAPLSLTLRYEYTDNNSNVDVYNYTRHIAGGYFSLAWP
ncbi:MAG: tetratricopeptide repeat protein [Deltaproteobacteria bacterium]|nr:tetratricopeptide repeat protein [Deltaproteobacteria bacterium]